MTMEERVQLLEKQASDLTNIIAVNATVAEDSATANSRRISTLEEKLQQLESVMKQDQAVLAEAILQTLKEEHLVKDIVQRVAAAIEAEWSGKFLPELRKTLRQDQADSGSQ